MRQSLEAVYVHPPHRLRCKPAIREGVFQRLNSQVDAVLADPALTELERDFFDSARRLDAERYAEIQRRYLIHSSERGLKFLNFGYFARKKLEIAAAIGLDRSAPLRVLDLGCGPGHFQFVARHFGHEAHGLDAELPDGHVFHDLCCFFDAPRRMHTIEPLRPLPAFPYRFDLVTALMTGFENGGAPWSAAAWRFLVEDVRANLLVPGGSFFVWCKRKRLAPEALDYLRGIAELRGRGLLIRA